MKHIAKTLFAFGLLSVLVFSCSDDDDDPKGKTEQELAIENLAGSGSITWAVSGGGSVSKDGTSQTGNFSDFEITFRNGGSAGLNYETVGGSGLFDASGSWNLEGENYRVLRLSGIQPAANKNIDYEKQGTDLRLELTIPPPPASRVEALIGYYIFTLKPKN